MANFLLIHCDQLRYDALAAHGHPAASTPNLDRLIADGVDFRHAFTPIAVCTPARACLLTGKWPTETRCLGIPGTEIQSPERTGEPVLTERLRDAGVWCGHVGKFHWETAEPPTERGCAEHVGGGQYKRWREEQGLHHAPRTQGWTGEIDEIRMDQTSLHWHASEVIRMIRDRKADGQPFFVRWDPPEPHLPCVPSREAYDRFADVDIPKWSSFDDPLVGKPYIQRQQLLSWGVEDWTWDEWAPVVRRYLAVIHELDAEVGRILDELEALGLADETTVVFTTDHGDLCGGHRMWDKHYMMYDDVYRVPLTLRSPGLEPSESDAFVAHELDVSATVYDVFDLPLPEGHRGRSLIGLAKGEIEPGEAAFAQYFGSQFGTYSQRMVRERDWKYVWNPTDVDELYDLRTDPGEIVNLIEFPDRRGDVKRLRARLVDWMREIGDPMLNHWTERQLIEGKKL